MKKSELKKQIDLIEKNIKSGIYTVEDLETIKNLYVLYGNRKITKIFYDLSFNLNKLDEFIKTYQLRKFNLKYKNKIYDLKNSDLFILMLKYDENRKNIFKKQALIDFIIFNIQNENTLIEITDLIDKFVENNDLKIKYFTSIASVSNKFNFDKKILYETKLGQILLNINTYIKKNNKLQFDYFLTNFLIEKNIEFVKEYKFDEQRNFKFDYFIPKYNIAIEYEGIGTPFNRHTSFVGYTNDLEKYNLATIKNYKILRYSKLNYTSVINDLSVLIPNI